MVNRVSHLYNTRSDATCPIYTDRTTSEHAQHFTNTYHASTNIQNSCVPLQKGPRVQKGNEVRGFDGVGIHAGDAERIKRLQETGDKSGREEASEFSLKTHSLWGSRS